MIRLGVNVPNFGPESSYDALLGWARFVGRCERRRQPDRIGEQRCR